MTEGRLIQAVAKAVSTVFVSQVEPWIYYATEVL